MSSFRRIDYSIRPAKHAERRMMCDIFRRLRPFQRIEEYTYVGFGSVWFSDFILFHKTLGVKSMRSIEQATAARARIEENKPFNILVDYRHSKDALPDLDWGSRMFIWLDYDDPISISVLQDVQTATQRAESGTVLAISLQCTQAPQVAEEKDDKSPDAPSAVKRMVSAFGAQRIAGEFTAEDLYGWSYGRLSRKIVQTEIEKEMAVRNSGSAEPIMRFHHICDFEYEDGAKMVTMVGIFVSPAEDDHLKACNFDALDFLPPGLKCLRIKVPKLTLREFKRLESQLPLSDGAALQLGTIPEGEARNFESMYRYLPNFASIEG